MAEATRLLTAKESGAAPSAKSARRKTPGSGKKPEAPPPPGTAATSGKPEESATSLVDSILNEAQLAYGEGNDGKAIELARMVRPDRPLPAWLLIGSIACRTRDVRLADQALQSLDAERQRYLLNACLKQGIVRQRGAFTLAE